MKRIKNDLLRVIDANFNRTKEGLRVAEDIFRFILESKRLYVKIKKLRHDLDAIATKNIIKTAAVSRRTQDDPGRKTDNLELNRRGALDIAQINLQRAKESLRVLEECFKVMRPEEVAFLKKMRYSLYAIEGDFLSKRW